MGMYEVFALAPSFNGDLSQWNTSRVTDMSGLFYGAVSFNRDISSWDVSSVTTMEYGMFHGAAAFNQNLCAWGEVFPYSVARNSFFRDTACTFRDPPQRSAKGPFCASDCLAPEPMPTTSPTTKSIKSRKSIEGTKTSKHAKARNTKSIKSRKSIKGTKTSKHAKARKLGGEKVNAEMIKFQGNPFSQNLK